MAASKCFMRNAGLCKSDLPLSSNFNFDDDSDDDCFITHVGEKAPSANRQAVRIKQEAGTEGRAIPSTFRQRYGAGLERKRASPTVTHKNDWDDVGSEQARKRARLKDDIRTNFGRTESGETAQSQPSIIPNPTPRVRSTHMTNASFARRVSPPHQTSDDIGQDHDQSRKPVEAPTMSHTSAMGAMRQDDPQASGVRSASANHSAGRIQLDPQSNVTRQTPESIPALKPQRSSNSVTPAIAPQLRPSAQSITPGQTSRYPSFLPFEIEDSGSDSDVDRDGTAALQVNRQSSELVIEVETNTSRPSETQREAARAESDRLRQEALERRRVLPESSRSRAQLGMSSDISINTTAKTKITLTYNADEDYSKDVGSPMSLGNSILKPNVLNSRGSDSTKQNETSTVPRKTFDFTFRKDPDAMDIDTSHASSFVSRTGNNKTAFATSRRELTETLPERVFDKAVNKTARTFVHSQPHSRPLITGTTTQGSSCSGTKDTNPFTTLAERQSTKPGSVIKQSAINSPPQSNILNHSNSFTIKRLPSTSILDLPISKDVVRPAVRNQDVDPKDSMLLDKSIRQLKKPQELTPAAHVATKHLDQIRRETHMPGVTPARTLNEARLAEFAKRASNPTNVPRLETRKKVDGYETADIPIRGSGVGFPSVLDEQQLGGDHADQAKRDAALKAMREDDAKRKAAADRKAHEKRQEEEGKWEEAKKVEDARREAAMKRQAEQRKEEDASNQRSAALETLLSGTANRRAAQALRAQETKKPGDDESRVNGSTRKKSFDYTPRSPVLPPVANHGPVATTPTSSSISSIMRTPGTSSKGKFNAPRSAREQPSFMEMRPPPLMDVGPKRHPHDSARDLRVQIMRNRNARVHLDDDEEDYEDEESELPPSAPLASGPVSLNSLAGQERIKRMYPDHKPSTPIANVQDGTPKQPKSNHERKLGEVTLADCNIVRWRDRGWDWPQIARACEQSFDLRRSYKTLRARYRTVTNGLAGTTVSMSLLNQAAEGDEDAKKQVNILIYGSWPIPKVANPNERQRDEKGHFRRDMSAAVTSVEVQPHHRPVSSTRFSTDLPAPANDTNFDPSAGIIRSHGRQLGEILPEDIRILKWHNDGLSFAQMEPLFKESFGYPRANSTLNRRWRQINEAFVHAKVSLALINKVDAGDEEARQQLNTQIHGQWPRPGVLCGRTVHGGSNRYHGEKNALEVESDESEFEFTQQPEPVNPKALSSRKQPDRQTPFDGESTGAERPQYSGKQLGHDTLPYYFGLMREDVFEQAYGFQWEISPVTERDYCYFTWGVLLRHLTKEEKDEDVTIDDVPWNRCGNDLFEDMHEANEAAAHWSYTIPRDMIAKLDARRGHTLVFRPSKDGRAFYELTWTDGGITQVQVEKGMRTYQQGVLPSNKENWYSKQQFFVKRQRSKKDENAELFGETKFDFQKEWTLNSKGYTVLDLANQRAIEEYIKFAYKPSRPNHDLIAYEKQELRDSLMADLNDEEKFKKSYQAENGMLEEFWVEEGELDGPRNL